jgi:pimeloyl-ACP methyl ester carboxylesterase
MIFVSLKSPKPHLSFDVTQPKRPHSTCFGTVAEGANLACYEGDRFVESMRYVRAYPEQLPELAELLPQIATPVTIINGRRDTVVPVTNAQFLDERLPNSRLQLIDAGHFVWEEAPAEYASIILDSISRYRS